MGPGIIMLIEALIGGVGTIMQAQKNKTAAAVGTDIATANQVVMAILQKHAEIVGLTIDWTDPAAVGAYVTSLQDYVPIPDPPPGTQS
jgi:hypothetical protein